MQRISLEEIVLQTKVKTMFSIVKKQPHHEQVFCQWSFLGISSVDSKLRTSSARTFQIKICCFVWDRPKWKGLFNLNGEILGFYSQTQNVQPSYLNDVWGKKRNYSQGQDINRFISFAVFQIQCSDHSCKVQKFLSQALDPPSPVAGKNSCQIVVVFCQWASFV